ncbi:MAG TPA: hypothetical protein VEW74_05690 [Candidatus Nitrosotalea sp.]|nr:hypothetical protein [Candidatus Nitrosotalea sp.]
MTLRDIVLARWLHANRAHHVAQLRAPAGNAPAPPSDLHALAQRELSVPGRYQLSGPPTVPYVEPWWVRVVRWLHDRWDAIWRALFGHVHVNGRTANTIGDAILVAAALMLIYAAYVILRNVSRARTAARLRTEPLAAPPDPQVLYQRACDAANAGEYGAAALLLFSATVALLDRRGAVARSASATVGDLRRALRSEDAALVPQFDAIAAPFVERAYAERNVGATQWQRAQAAFTNLLSSSADSLSS